MGKDNGVVYYWQPTFDDYKGISLARYYGGMFKRLYDIGCSYKNLEYSLSAYSISDYKVKLISHHPNLNNQIATIIKTYEKSIFNCFWSNINNDKLL